MSGLEELSLVGTEVYSQIITTVQCDYRKYQRLQKQESGDYIILEGWRRLCSWPWRTNSPGTQRTEGRGNSMCRCHGVCSGTVRYPEGVEPGTWDVRLEVSVGRGHIPTGSACHAEGSGFHPGGVTEHVRGHGQIGMLDH